MGGVRRPLRGLRRCAVTVGRPISLGERRPPRRGAPRPAHGSSPAARASSMRAYSNDVCATQVRAPSAPFSARAASKCLPPAASRRAPWRASRGSGLRLRSTRPDDRSGRSCRGSSSSSGYSTAAVSVSPTASTRPSGTSAWPARATRVDGSSPSAECARAPRRASSSIPRSAKHGRQPGAPGRHPRRSAASNAHDRRQLRQPPLLAPQAEHLDAVHARRVAPGQQACSTRASAAPRPPARARSPSQSASADA